MRLHVTQFLEDSAARWPDQVAWADKNTSVDYRTAKHLVDSIASYVLSATDSAKNRPVFVCIDRSVESLAMLLGVARSGNFYVPVDLTLPQTRLQQMQEVMEPALVLTTSDCTADPFPAFPRASFEEVSAYPADEALLAAAESRAKDTDPLYCIFTSGSTGVPKGVLISHRSVFNMAEQFSEAFGFDHTAVFGNQAPFDFDVSTKDIYLTLRNGGQLHILERQLFSAPKRLVERLNECRVNTLIWAVSAMRILSTFKTFEAARPEHLRTVMFSGEVLPCKILNDWVSHLPGVRFVNLYGPTEITCNCTYYIVDRPYADQEKLPIGRPFPNTKVFLLSDGHEVTTPGEVGEICVTGTCLGLGYYKNPERTAAAFCQNPLQDFWPERIYRTGDLGSWNDQGELMFQGRGDSQVKCNGFRVELGEIEIAANAIPFVSAACCLFDPKREQLCLFYQAEEQNDRDLVTTLRSVLPRYMVPTRLFYFEKMPQNRTGKIDRAGLKRTYIDETD